MPDLFMPDSVTGKKTTRLLSLMFLMKE